ncbi:probable polygalacturonase At3g15720 [Lycium ferocissimum]|uniref:probable polygalacturonase At3g15720 n=1 Tax=Lycium ferocissimum TaxID=112874 RepID=UPI0028149955|nr:probable polygalacturonase At3g15720 [Lycium ferocissimum]
MTSVSIYVTRTSSMISLRLCRVVAIIRVCCRFMLKFLRVDFQAFSYSLTYLTPGNGWIVIQRLLTVLISNIEAVANRLRVIHFNFCNDLQFNGVNLVDSPRNHISITFSKKVTISHITVSALEDSPNTDGIDISTSHQVHILDSTIQRSDDCIVINLGGCNIKITGISCGSRRGISVGSLGVNGTFATVDNINVAHCTLQGTQNGVETKPGTVCRALDWYWNFQVKTGAKILATG